MLVKPPMEKLLPKVANRYVLAMLVAKRARQLVNGAQPLSYSDSPNLVTVACEEIGADKVACVRGRVDAYVPLRPEIEAARLAAQAAQEEAEAAEAIREGLNQVASKPPIMSDNVAAITEQLVNPEALKEGKPAQEAADEDDGDNTLTADDSNAAFPFKLAAPVEVTDYLNKAEPSDQAEDETEGED